MAESEFARRLLEKQGWEEGDGLGKKRDGISKPIKASLKFDKTGFGHDPGSEFKDHWWLRVFNNAASTIAKAPEVEVSESPPAPQNKLYKGFVRGSVLSNGKEEKDSDCSSDEDEMENSVDPSSIPTLDDIHKYCGGATGHRAATLGIKMKGKLSRAAEQERLFNEKIKTPETNGVQTANGGVMEPLKKKKKKKKILEPTEHVEETEEEMLSTSMGVIMDEDNVDSHTEKRKRKRRLKENENCDTSEKVVDDCGVDINEQIQDVVDDEILRGKKKKKKKKRKEEEDDESVICESPSEQEVPVKSKSPKKKSKCDSKDDLCETVENDIETLNRSIEEPKSKKKKKKKKHKE